MTGTNGTSSNSSSLILSDNSSLILSLRNGSSSVESGSSSGSSGNEVVNCSLYYNYSFDEAESAIPCTEKWSSLLSKYSFATEGVGLFTVAIVGEFIIDINVKRPHWSQHQALSYLFVLSSLMSEFRKGA